MTVRNAERFIRKPDSTRDRRMTPDATEFIRRFLQHVLPSGFMKVRYYGFLNPNSAVKPEAVRCAVGLCHAFEVQTPEPVAEPLRPLCCPDCGGEPEYRCSVLPFQMPPVAGYRIAFFVCQRAGFEGRSLNTLKLSGLENCALMPLQRLMS